MKRIALKPEEDTIRLIHCTTPAARKMNFIFHPIKLGDVTEFFVLALAHVQAAVQPLHSQVCVRVLAVLFTLPHPLTTPLNLCILSAWSPLDDHKAPLHTCRREGGGRPDKHKGNQQIPFAWALRNIIGPNHHLFSFVKSLTAGLDKSEWKICRPQDAAKTFTDKSPPYWSQMLIQPANFHKWYNDYHYRLSNFISACHIVGPLMIAKWNGLWLRPGELFLCCAQHAGP